MEKTCCRTGFRHNGIKGNVRKKVLNRNQKKEAVIIGKEVVGERRACLLVNLHRSVFRYNKTDKDFNLKEEILNIAIRKKRYGYRRIYEVIRKKRSVNHKKIYRLYCELGLKYRRKNKKKKNYEETVPLILPDKINERWSMDFVTDSLYNGRRFRVFNMIDDYSKEAIVQYVDYSISGIRLTRIFDELKMKRKLPKQIICDNGPEFISKALRKWSKENGVELHYIEKGKPTQNAFIESFNGKFRDECLNAEWFSNLSESRKIIEAWRVEYNSERPHSALNGMTPYEFIKKIA